MRTYLIEYLGFCVAEQKRCCYVCESMDESVSHEEPTVDPAVRSVSTDCHVNQLKTELRAELLKFQLTCQNNLLYILDLMDMIDYCDQLQRSYKC